MHASSAPPLPAALGQLLRYLGRYTHRMAISNHRLLAFNGQKVSFLWRDYAHGCKQRVMTLGAMEFLRRFFLHVLPKGFVRIRHYGLLSNHFRKQLRGQYAVYSARSMIAGSILAARTTAGRAARKAAANNTNAGKASMPGSLPFTPNSSVST